MLSHLVCLLDISNLKPHWDIRVSVLKATPKSCHFWELLAVISCLNNVGVKFVDRPGCLSDF